MKSIVPIYSRFLPDLVKVAEQESTPRNITAIAGAALGGGLAQHALPAVGVGGMTAFKRGAAVAGLIGGGNLVGRKAYDRLRRGKEKKAEINAATTSMLARAAAAEQRALRIVPLVKPGKEKKAAVNPFAAGLLAGAAAGGALGAGVHLGVEWSVGPDGRKRLRAERRDPRLYSNFRGMVTGETSAERVHAHRSLAKGDGTILGAMRVGFGRQPEVSKTAAPRASGARLLQEFGPPNEWSGSVAAALGPDRRTLISQHWRGLSAPEKARALASFKARFRAEFGS